MDSKLQKITYMTDSLERELLEQELRAMAQREAAQAFARGVRRVLNKIRTALAGSRQSGKSGLRSA